MPIVDDLGCHLCRLGKTCKIRGDVGKMHEVALRGGKCQIYKPISEALPDNGCQIYKPIAEVP